MVSPVLGGSAMRQDGGFDLSGGYVVSVTGKSQPGYANNSRADSADYSSLF